MSFTLETFNQATSGKNTEAVTVYTYSTPDTIETGGAGYFDEIKGALKIGDIIDMVFDTDSAPATQYTKLRVTQVDPEVQVVFMAQSFFDDSYYLTYRLDNQFFGDVSRIATVAIPIEELGYSQVRITGLTIQYQFSAGAILPYVFSISTPAASQNIVLNALAPGDRLNVGFPLNNDWVITGSDLVQFTSNAGATVPQMEIFDVLIRLQPVA